MCSRLVSKGLVASRSVLVRRFDGLGVGTERDNLEPNCWDGVGMFSRLQTLPEGFPDGVRTDPS